MRTCFEVSYRNMWPSETLNELVRGHVERLKQLTPQASSCHALFERTQVGGRLRVCVEAYASGHPLVAQHTLERGATHSEVCRTLERVFEMLQSAARRTLAQALPFETASHSAAA